MDNHSFVVGAGYVYKYMRQYSKTMNVCELGMGEEDVTRGHLFSLCAWTFVWPEFFPPSNTSVRMKAIPLCNPSQNMNTSWTKRAYRV